MTKTLLAQIADDAACFLDASTGFAETVQIAGVDVDGVYTDAFVPLLVGEVEVDSSAPRFKCLTSAVATVQEGTALVRAGVTFTIRSIERERHGLSTLVLERVQ